MANIRCTGGNHLIEVTNRILWLHRTGPYISYGSAGGGHSLLYPKATTFMSHLRAYSWSETAIVTCN